MPRDVEQGRRPEHVHEYTGPRARDGPRNRRDRRFVEDDLDPFESLLHGLGVDDARLDHVELSVQPLEILSSSTREVVEDSHDLALPEERATRRANEVALPPEIVERQIRERDQRDRGRAESPLVQAPDAVYVDTTGLSIDEVEAAILKIIRDRTSNGRERTQ